MKSFGHYRERLREKDFYDFFNKAHGMAARVKGAIWYAAVFGRFGKRSWLKKPELIFGSGRIFIGDDVRIETGAVLYAIKRYGGVAHAGHVKIGNGTYVNRMFNATSAVGIEIGEGVAFGTNVFLCDFDHGYANPAESRISSALVTKGPVKIGDRCWIGSNSFVASGVELGEGCVVGANSVVTRSFPAFTVLGGSPAKALRRFDPLRGAWIRAEPELS